MCPDTPLRTCQSLGRGVSESPHATHLQLCPPIQSLMQPRETLRPVNSHVRLCGAGVGPQGAPASPQGSSEAAERGRSDSWGYAAQAGPDTGGHRVALQPPEGPGSWPVPVDTTWAAGSSADSTKANSSWGTSFSTGGPGRWGRGSRGLLQHRGPGEGEGMWPLLFSQHQDSVRDPARPPGTGASGKGKGCGGFEFRDEIDQQAQGHTGDKGTRGP